MSGPAWQSQLRAAGYRLTPQRQLVLQGIERLGHATPEALASDALIAEAGVNLSTIYRTLELLESLGLVTHTHLGHGAPTYHVAHDDDHVHLVCRSCERVQEVPPAVLDAVVERLAAEQGFAVDVEHVAIFGRCRDCQTDTTDRPHQPHGAHWA